MQHPGRGTPYTVRTLAREAQCQPATIGHLLSGRYRRTEEAAARRIADALGCPADALFAIKASTDLDETATNIA
jgi:plasmid maintenance system antidote protein VapI